MKNAFWNYSEQVRFRVVEVKLHSVDKPILHWQNAFAGEIIQAVQVFHHGSNNFLICNQDGSALRKIEGRGGPQYMSRHISQHDIVGEVHDEGKWIQWDKNKSFQIHQTIALWQKDNHPAEFEQLENLRKSFPKV